MITTEQRNHLHELLAENINIPIRYASKTTGINDRPAVRGCRWDYIMSLTHPLIVQGLSNRAIKARIGISLEEVKEAREVWEAQWALYDWRDRRDAEEN